jgi:hypothetical protein
MFYTVLILEKSVARPAVRKHHVQKPIDVSKLCDRVMLFLSELVQMYPLISVEMLLFDDAINQV